MNSKNRNTVDNIKSEVESILKESNNIDKSRSNIWKILDNKLQRNEITDFRLNVDFLTKKEKRDRTLQSLLNEVDPLCEPLLNKFNITIQLPNETEFISLDVVQMI